MSIRELNPEIVWKYFDDLTKIPRPSKHEEKVIDYLRNFGALHQLETVVDKTGNVLIKKPATREEENTLAIALQSHIDMVPQKNSYIQFDFEKDAIQTYIDGEWLTAKDTTLGADNGIGVAAMLAVLASDEIAHGPLEALFTVDEETGMTGAFGLQPGFLSAETMLNLDTEEYGVFCVGCAGGMDTTATKSYVEEAPEKSKTPYKISVSGLKGGHSGMDINLGRGNANKLLIRLLSEIREFGTQLAKIDGGGLRNAIPREAIAIIFADKKDFGKIENHIRTYQHTLKNELKGVDDDVKVSIVETDAQEKVIGDADLQLFLKVIQGLPNGAMRMIPDLPQVTETSSNMARIELQDGKIKVLCLLRSAIESSKKALGISIQSVFELGGFEVIHSGAYPGWTPDFDSEILKTMKSIYYQIEGEEAEVEVTHGGLECGIIGSVFPKMHLISFGPTIKYPHSPDEKVHIPSVKKFWEFLVRVLQEVK